MSQWRCAKYRLPFLTYNSFKLGLSQPMRQCEEYSHLCERLITFSFSWQHFADGGKKWVGRCELLTLALSGGKAYTLTGVAGGGFGRFV